MRALIVADGDVNPADTLPVAGALIVAADGGARKAELLGLMPDVVIGDMDSLAPEQLVVLESRGVEIQRHPGTKDESDTELAVLEAVRRGATELVILGALGGSRFEHTLANVLLLTLPELAGRDAMLVDGPTTVRVLGVSGPDRLQLRGTPTDLVSLLPLTEQVHGVTTTGLAYPLAGETLRQGSARGVSNVFLEPECAVSTTSGRLAVIHTRRPSDADA